MQLNPLVFVACMAICYVLGAVTTRRLTRIDPERMTPLQTYCAFTGIPAVGMLSLIFVAAICQCCGK